MGTNDDNGGVCEGKVRLTERFLQHGNEEGRGGVEAQVSFDRPSSAAGRQVTDAAMVKTKGRVGVWLEQIFDFSTHVLSWSALLENETRFLCGSLATTPSTSSPI